MAYCHGPNSPYGCGHAHEHSIAAKKGWVTRRHGAAFEELKRDEDAVGLLFGQKIEESHEGANHKNLILFKQGGQWYELPKKEFHRLAQEGRRFQKKLARAQKREDEEEARREVRYLREVARLERRKAREEEKRALREAREGEKARRAEERYRQVQERQLEAARRAEYKSVVKFIRDQGGIKPNRPNAQGKIPELEEWRDLPRSVKTRSERGFALDYITQAVKSHFPELRIEYDTDLAQYLQKEERRQRNRRLVRGKAA